MDDVEAAIRGGSIFAAGGGGWADHGRMLGTAAVNAGEPEHPTHAVQLASLLKPT